MEIIDEAFVWPIKHTIPIVTIPPSGKYIKFSLSMIEREQLASYLNIPDVLAYEADLHLKPTSSGDIWVNSVANCVVTYQCGVSLENYNDTLQFEIKSQFVDAERRKEIISKWDLEDDVLTERVVPEEIKHNSVDIGALLCEVLAVELNPFPRKPEAKFQYIFAEDGNDNPTSPFSILKGNL